MLRKIMLFKLMPVSVDLSLLVIRVLVSVSLLLKHGVEKVFHYPDMLTRITGNHHYVPLLGVGLSLFCAMIADGILTVLLMFGVMTRLCAALCFLNIFVAWSFVLGFSYFAPLGSPRPVVIGGTQGEMMVAYMAILLALLFAGGGKYSLDQLLDRDEVHGASI